VADSFRTWGRESAIRLRAFDSLESESLEKDLQRRSVVEGERIERSTTGIRERRG